MSDSSFRRRLPIGAELVDPRTAHIRVWAPAATRVAVVTRRGERSALVREDGGYFSGRIAAAAGDLYQFQIDDDEKLYPDPASRFQPEGPHGPSEVVDPGAFQWHDDGWTGVSREGQVVYELHLGTFTSAGTWAAAANELPELARLGITIVEVMPVAEFEGRFGWGYDGVDLYAPSHVYGTPDDFRRFVDAAHATGLGVILDVVYNHLGPAGNYLRMFAPAYFTDRYENEWGESINFDGDDAGPVREFFVCNAGYWIDEFHLDGLRLDATQSIHDGSEEHVLAAITTHARDMAGARSIFIVAENEPQTTRLVQPIAHGGYGLDALWNDDFHHSAMVALTGRAEAYYSDTRGEPQEFISAAKYGYLFQGQQYHWQRDRRGSATWGLPPSAFIAFTQNHDQVANSARGLRGHQLTSPGRWRAITALLLLQPATPMLFQGQQYHWQRDRRGSATWGLPPSAFIAFTQNHDQVANSARGLRGHQLTSPGRWRAITALLLLQPTTPMLFQGQEFSASAPFLYFADFGTELNAAVRAGRGEFLTQFPSVVEARRQGLLSDPCALETFERSRLDLGERESHGEAYALHRDLLRIRRDEMRFAPDSGGVDGAVLSAAAFILRFFTPDHRDDRVLVVNLGADLQRGSVAEPLLAPPPDSDWHLRWSSDDAVYGGPGIAELFPDEWWHIPAESAVLLAPGPRRPRPPSPRVPARG